MWYKILKEYIKTSKMSLVQFAGILGISKQYLSDILSGRKPPPNADTIIKILEYFENKLALSHEEVYVFLVAAIKEKAPENIRRLLNELGARLHQEIVVNEQLTNEIQKRELHEVIIGQYTHRILQGISFIDESDKALVLRFMDSLLNQPTDRIVKFLELIEP
jgi:transcriptional regulator with XRE-family HTH domain